MRTIASLAALLINLFLLVLFIRVVFDWVQVFAREWRPRGVALVVAEAVYTVTDPPLRALRRVIPPLTLGAIRLDMAFLVLVVICVILQSILVRI
ncbi:YggT family protein [Cellulomonas sp. ATA003]|uniref:YggT family protein n=1 Tax=Cellulomonas sp. ATA003 TaxID=3073064 RepID=UPI002872C449|nr:YggT family protein [Cellulomonas sp. ATA003]WNB84847.1 YggT family protein [Cellulomonas sp. ATA003]